ncbi:hypothetical protein [Noviherbaspirillum sp. ST9]|uniref:hypothetical protein n=1 Tax=Noviherbaspirillum sp. ST9 TaxID=3401606 RepID=UPI003B58AF3E
MQRVLSFEQTPALAVPLRFFLTAPAFAVLAGVLLLWSGPGMFVSRWTPETLALTHLLTLGFLGMCMIGALLQILPVVAGIDIPYTRHTAAGIYGLLASGTVALSAAFLAESPVTFRIALLLLGCAFAWLLLSVLWRVWTAQHAAPMLIAIRMALTSLAAAVAFGLAAGSGFAWPLQLPLLLIADLHVSWGLLGWVGLLVAGVAYQVVPMFQVTPVYPQWMTRGLAWAVFALLVLRTAVSVLVAEWEPLLTALLVLVWVAFCVATFHLLRQRKRPKPDATTFFWKTSLASGVCAALLWTAALAFPTVEHHPAYPLATGALLIVGFGYSVINGMLYKIVPFLAWYHLQNKLAGSGAKPPSVKQLLPDRDAERQFELHLLALVLLVAATLFPGWMSHAAALAFIASSGWLWLNLLKSMRKYREMVSNASALPAV